MDSPLKWPFRNSFEWVHLLDADIKRLLVFTPETDIPDFHTSLRGDCIIRCHPCRVGQQNGGTLGISPFLTLVAAPLVATRPALGVKFMIWGAYTQWGALLKHCRNPPDFLSLIKGTCGSENMKKYTKGYIYCLQDPFPNP